MLLVQIITPDLLEEGEDIECDVCNEMTYSDKGMIEHTFTPDELDTGNPHYFDFLKDDEDDIEEGDDDDDDGGDGFLPPPNFKD